jgi:hypothetical protein
MTEQLELFTDEYRDPANLVARYRKLLTEWPAEIMSWRHHRESSGWSMATGGYSFARSLFFNRKITRVELRRWWKFHQRVKRWDRRTA